MKKSSYYGLQQLLMLFILTAFMSSCELKGLTSPETPTWEIELFGPLAQTETVRLDSISEFQNLSYQSNFPLSSPFPNILIGQPIIIPPITAVDLDPISVTIDDFNTLRLDSGSIYFTITNKFPINIKAGLEITLSSGGNVLFSHIVTSDIQPDATYTMNPKGDLANKIMFDDLTVAINQFASDGFGNGTTDVITLTENPSSEIDLFIDDLKIKSITVKKGNNFSIEELTPFNLVGDEVVTELAQGDLILYVTNGMPLDIAMTIDFYDVNEEYIATLLTENIDAANIDTNGEVISEKETGPITVTVDETLSTALTKTKFMKLGMNMTVPEPHNSVVLELSQGISTEIIGDLKVTVQK